MGALILALVGSQLVLLPILGFMWHGIREQRTRLAQEYWRLQKLRMTLISKGKWK